MNKVNNKHICVTCKEKCYYFSLVKDSYLELIDQNKVDVSFKKGEMICKQGSYSSNAIFLTEGSAKLFIEGVQDKNLMLSIILPYNFIGLPEIFGDNIYHFSAIALEDSSACFIKIESFIETIENNKEFSMEIIKFFGKNGCLLFDKFINLTQKHLRGRLADALIYLIEDVYKTTDFILTLTRKDLSELANMSTENSIRILSEFKKEGILDIDNKRITVQNLVQLKKISKIG